MKVKTMIKSVDKLKRGCRTFRKYEDKASVPVFFLSVLVFIVAGLFYLTPAANDKVYFIGFLTLVLVVLVSWLGVWVKKRNEYINKEK
jgi:hypothetical protein